MPCALPGRLETGALDQMPFEMLEKSSDTMKRAT